MGAGPSGGQKGGREVASEKVVLHRTGWKKWPEYDVWHNGHHYEICRYPGEEVWTVVVDGEAKEGSYWLRDIRGSIAAGDYED